MSTIEIEISPRADTSIDIYIYVCLEKIHGTSPEGKYHVLRRDCKKCGQYLSEKLSPEQRSADYGCKIWQWGPLIFLGFVKISMHILEY